jgi:hypothetical protein
MKKLQKILILIIFLSGACFSLHGSASAASASFKCNSNFYQVISGQLNVLNPLTGAYTPIGSNAGFDYNGIGYDTLDNYIYGFIVSGPQTGDLIQVAADGTTIDLGLPTGLPRSGYITGTFDPSGNLYVEGSSQTIYKINIASMTTSTLSITGDNLVNGADDQFVNNNLYILTGSNLTQVNLNNNTATTGIVSGPAGWLNASSTFGAAWADQAGELFFSNNGSGSIYQIINYNSPTPTAVFKAAGTITSNNDGASCSAAPQNPFDPPAANNDSYATPFNTPLHETTTPVLNNDVGNTLTVTSDNNPSHGTLSMNTDGTFLYTPLNGFSGTDTFTYTVADYLGRTASASVTIVVGPPLIPNTGYGTPASSRPPRLIGILGVISVTSIMSGIVLLERKKHNS